MSEDRLKNLKELFANGEITYEQYEDYKEGEECESWRNEFVGLEDEAGASSGPDMKSEEDKNLDRLRNSIRMAMADGVITDSEKRMVNKMREDLGIPRETASALFREVRREIGNPTLLSPHSDPNRLPETLTNSIGTKLRLIPAGTFRMGSEDGNNDETPVHWVTISGPFYIGVYPVTQAEWEATMGNEPSTFKGSNRPVEMINWNEAQEFCEKLSAKDVRIHRLPSEAEWEYACRAGAQSEFHYGDSGTPLREYAWYGENSGGRTREVGTRGPNAFGLFDMHGNVWEWCQDWYRKDFYGDHGATEISPECATSPPRCRVVRGGYWASDFSACRSAMRDGHAPTRRLNSIGFRVVVPVSTKND